MPLEQLNPNGSCRQTLRSLPLTRDLIETCHSFSRRSGNRLVSKPFGCDFEDAGDVLVAQGRLSGQGFQFSKKMSVSTLEIEACLALPSLAQLGA